VVGNAPDPRSQDEVDANAGTGGTEYVGPEGARGIIFFIFDNNALFQYWIDKKYTDY
jgi:hypothetical protein